MVKALEVGGLSLDESLRLWERGEKLARLCEQRLSGARERVEAALSNDPGEDTAGDGTTGEGTAGEDTAGEGTAGRA